MNRRKRGAPANVISLQQYRHEKELQQQQAEAETAILQDNLQRSIKLGHLVGVMGFVGVDMDSLPPQEQLDMICQTFLGLDHHDTLDYYRQQHEQLNREFLQ